MLQGMMDASPNTTAQQEKATNSDTRSQSKVLNFSKSKPRKKKGDDMKNLTKRADGRWTGRKQIDGKTIIVYARTQKECYERLKQAIQKPAPKTKHNTNKIKLLDFANTWFETYKKNQIGPKNQESYKNVIKNHLSNINKNIQDITSLDIQTFLNNMPATRIKEFTFMVAKQIFRKAKELKIIKDNPCDYVEKGKIQKNKREWFNLEEQKTLLENLPTNKTGLIIKTLLLTGARPSELNGITKQDIHNDYIHIQGTKTKNAVRWVKISDTLKNELLSQPNDIIFKYYLNRLQKDFRTLMNKLNMKGTLYGLRHTYASNLFYLGVPDKQRQYFMGHSSIVLTNDIYTTYDPTITKKDILNLYKDLYPNFDTTFDTTF